MNAAIVDADPTTDVDALKLVLLGPPGSGKGTQAAPLCAQLDLPYIATGDLLRDHRRRDTELGREAARYMAEGRLVPDELVIAMIVDRLEDDGHSFLLDGFPRTLAQAEALSDVLEVTAALLVDAPDDAIVERIAGRRQCAQGHIYHVVFDPPAREGVCDRDGEPLFRRDDDAPETVRERLRVYHELTEPAIGYYAQRGLLHRVDGMRAPAEVQRELLSAVRTAGGSRPRRPAV
jgi:adenylate kinase